jgi:hypothetical protein
VHGHASLDGFDNCDLHPDQCFGCPFGQKRRDFLGKKCFYSSKFDFFGRKLTKFSIPQMEKETLILM